MNKVSITDIEMPTSNSSADVLHPLSYALETDDLAVNYYELAPGESFGYAYHRHNDQEEVFYIQTGAATFETETGAVEVEAGDVIRFAPGEFQLGTNQTDNRVKAFALGAPRDSREIEYLIDCSHCGERTLQKVELSEEQDALLIRCSDCGTETDRMTI